MAGINQKYYDDFVAPHIDEIIFQYSEGITSLEQLLSTFGLDYDRLYACRNVSPKVKKLFSVETKHKNLYNTTIGKDLGEFFYRIDTGAPLVDILYAYDISRFQFDEMIKENAELREVLKEAHRIDDDGNLIAWNDNSVFYERVIKGNWNEIEMAIYNGMSMEKLCEKLKISESTLYKLRRDFPEFNAMIESTDMKIMDMRLKDTLKKCAHGFKYDEKKIIRKRNLKTGEETEQVEIQEKFYQPNLQAVSMCEANLIKNDDWITSDRLSADIKRREIKLKEDSAW